MELKTDRLLRGPIWGQTIDQLAGMFKPRTNYMIYMLSMAIGIMYDKRIAKPEENGEEPRNVPRNVFQNNDNGQLDFMFQAAILTTTTVDMSEDERLNLAFGDKDEAGFDKMGFLSEFANFGVTKLHENIGSSPVETMENIKNFLAASVEGNNLDIDSLPDDYLLPDE